VAYLRVYELRDQFRIIGNDKELIGNVPSNIESVPRDTGKVPGMIGNVPVKELCKLLLFNVFSI
jgi:hypothetical protein